MSSSVKAFLIGLVIGMLLMAVGGITVSVNRVEGSGGTEAENLESFAWHGVIELGAIALLFVVGPLTVLVGSVGCLAAWIGGREQASQGGTRTLKSNGDQSGGADETA